jgi:hypothetical protein
MIIPPYPPYPQCPVSVPLTFVVAVGGPGVGGGGGRGGDGGGGGSGRDGSGGVVLLGESLLKSWPTPSRSPSALMTAYCRQIQRVVGRERRVSMLPESNNPSILPPKIRCVSPPLRVPASLPTNHQPNHQTTNQTNPDPSPTHPSSLSSLLPFLSSLPGFSRPFSGHPGATLGGFSRHL